MCVCVCVCKKGSESELRVHYLCAYSLLLILMKSDSVLVMCERVCVGVSKDGLGPPHSLLALVSLFIQPF